jgi:flagellar motility protein MotE (MotC chaperone)
MKTFAQVIGIICVLHMLALGGFVGYLAGTDRLSRDRVLEAAQMFRVTITEEAELAKAAAEADAQSQEIAARVELTSGKSAPTSVAQRLAEERQRNEITLRQLERTRQEIESLRMNLTQRQAQMDRERDELLAEKQALEQRLKDLEQRYNEEGFRKAVALYESLPAKQVKQMFVGLLESNETDQVISYLESMQPRKAAAILKEFKTQAEALQAAQLTQKLRERGSELTRDMEAAG